MSLENLQLSRHPSQPSLSLSILNFQPDALTQVVARLLLLGFAYGGMLAWRIIAQRSTLSTQHSALIIQHSTLNTQHSTLDTQHSTLNTQHSTLDTQHSTLNTQHFNCQPDALTQVVARLLLLCFAYGGMLAWRMQKNGRLPTPEITMRNNPEPPRPPCEITPEICLQKNGILPNPEIKMHVTI